MEIQELKEQMELTIKNLQRNISDLDKLQTEENFTKVKINKCIFNIQKDIYRMSYTTKLLLDTLPLDNLLEIAKNNAKEKLFGGKDL